MSKTTPIKLPKVLVWTGASVGALLGLITLMLVLAGFFTPKVASVPPAVTSSAVPTRDLGEVQRLRQPRVETAIGTVRPVHEASVASKLLARVAEVRVTAGQTVSRGDVLIRLEDAELQARLKQMESAQAAVQAALERAVLDHDRARSLVDKNVISRADFDQSVATLKTAQADLQRTQQSVEEAKVLLEFATIRSPLTGVIIEKHVDSGDMALPGQVLVNLFEPNRMQMVTTVRESLALRLKVGDQVPARLDALNYECLATVSEVVPQAEATSRAFTVKVTGPCPPGAYSGMFGRISIPLDDEEFLVVPASAIVHVGQLELVDVVQEGKVMRRIVQVGRSTGTGYEVLAGLSAGDKVVLHEAGEGRR